MVYTEAEFAAACVVAHEVDFDLFGAKVVEGLDEVEEGAHFEGIVDLGKLGELGKEARA